MKSKSKENGRKLEQNSTMNLNLMQLPMKIGNKNYLFSGTCDSNFQRTSSLSSRLADTVSNNIRK